VRLLICTHFTSYSILAFNVSGQKSYPKWTNHFNRISSLKFRSTWELTRNFHSGLDLVFQGATQCSNIVQHWHCCDGLCRRLGFCPVWHLERHQILWYSLARSDTLVFVVSDFGLLFTNRLDTVIMITYLHHTAPDIPHYRGKTWNFQRGAAATIDRDFLGWQGRFFLHDVAHYHVIHHASLIMNPLPLIIAEHSSNSFSPRCHSASTF